jgi:hypothetical protein
MPSIRPGMVVCGDLVNIMNAYQEVAKCLSTRIRTITFSTAFILSVNQQDTRANVDAQANLNFALRLATRIGQGGTGIMQRLLWYI